MTTLHLKYKTLLNNFYINTPLRLAHFFAQIHQESNGFKSKKENLNYSVRGLLATFGRHRISIKDAYKYGRLYKQKANQEAIANLVYGGEWGRKNLGNTEPGDGAKYIGRGYKQLTGRFNYTRFAKDMRLPHIIEHPELVETEPYDFLSAVWFWNTNKLNRFADKDDVRGLTKAINGGYNGFKNRINLTKKYKKHFGV